MNRDGRRGRGSGFSFLTSRERGGSGRSIVAERRGRVVVAVVATIDLVDIVDEMEREDARRGVGRVMAAVVAAADLTDSAVERVDVDRLVDAEGMLYPEVAGRRVVWALGVEAPG